jgi:hypothetical protein
MVSAIILESKISKLMSKLENNFEIEIENIFDNQFCFSWYLSNFVCGHVSYIR